MWMVMAGGESADIGPGVVAALLAAWVSALLMPPDPGSGGVRPLILLRALARFFWGSVVGGVGRGGGAGESAGARGVGA